MELKKIKFHFVGIGGIGMCGLAELLHNMGAQVTGSDLSENANTDRLKKIGVKIFKGHQASNVGDADVVVFTSAAKSDNPELQEASKKHIPLIPRAEALAEIMHLKRGLAVAGTHGKTTTTSMTASIFLEAKTNPTIVVGGRFDLIDSTALLGDGEWLVAEADESDGSFHKLSPEMVIITNIDSDHLDHFRTFENLKKSFQEFAMRIPFYGIAVVCGDDKSIQEIFKNFPKRFVTYGFNKENDFVISGSHGKYELSDHGKSLGSFEVAVPGKHNALNATAAIICGLKAGFSFDVCVKGLKKFQGVDRRFHFKGQKKGIKIYDDYGHHPTEVKATLQAFKEKFPTERIVVMFQPHRYSRTQSCWEDFKTCFADCDHLILTDIYAAGETPISGINALQLQKEVKHNSSKYFSKNAELAEKIISELKEGDIFLTLGAGDGWKVGMEILEKL